MKDCKKAVVISTSTDAAFYQRTVKMITEKNAFDCCTIVSAAHSSILNYNDTVPLEDRVDYAKLKRDVKSWMCSNQRSQVTYTHLWQCPIAKRLVLASD